MKEPITADTQYHDLMAEGLSAAVKGADFEPRLAEITDFFKANPGKEEGFGYMVIESTDVGLTLGQIAEQVSPVQVDEFVDGMFRAQFTKLDVTQTGVFDGMTDQEIDNLTKAVVGAIEFACGDPSLTAGKDPDELPRTPVRKPGGPR